MIKDDEFVKFQTLFFDQFCHEFDNEEENKLVYMDIFKNYVILLYVLECTDMRCRHNLLKNSFTRN